MGFISPEEFIPLAERDGNIIHIGEQVLEQCCRFLSKHVLSNGSLGIRTIHVNISMVQCLRQNLTETIRPVLESYHIPPVHADAGGDGAHGDWRPGADAVAYA